MVQSFLGGDTRFFWPENLHTIISLPQAWDATLNTGIGQSSVGTLWITSFLNFTASFTSHGLSWNTVLLLFWVIPAFIIGFWGSYALFSFFFPDKRLYAVIAGIIYLSNTYVLLLLFGGQLGVLIAYALTPFVLLVFSRLLLNQTLVRSLIFGSLLSIQLLFDPRFVYMTLIILGIYFLFTGFLKKITFRLLLFIAGIPVVIVLLLHSFWIIPLILYKAPTLPQSFDSTAGFRFFSFATFSNALGLLHPNWPDNIFGKVHFMRPEFLVLPILAYSSLLVLNTKGKIQKIRLSINRTVLFFAFLGLLGVFLSKGANEPFSFINVFLFEHLPGMQMFRDPTKWYLFISLESAMLIPFSLSQLQMRINEKRKAHLPALLRKVLQAGNKKQQFKMQSNLLVIIFIIFWIFLIYPAFPKIQNLVIPHTIPQSYVQLKDFLEQDKTLSRTLWIPKWQRYGYFSFTHPAIGRGELIKEGSPSAMIAELQKEKTKENLRLFDVNYLIVPEDSEGEIFLNDGYYSDQEYQKTVAAIKKIPWLKEVRTIGKIAVFSFEQPKDRFWSPSSSLNISYQLLKPTRYVVAVKDAKKGDRLVFSESFDHNWIAKIRSKKKEVRSKEYHTLNSFVLPKDGDYTLEIFYEPQQWVERGLVISLVTLTVIIGFLITIRRKKK